MLEVTCEICYDRGVFVGTCKESDVQDMYGQDMCGQDMYGQETGR